MKKFIALLIVVINVNIQSQNMPSLILSEDEDQISSLVWMNASYDELDNLHLMFDTSNRSKKNNSGTSSRYMLYAQPDGNDYIVSYMQQGLSFYDDGKPSGHANLSHTWTKGDDFSNTVLDHFFENKDSIIIRLPFDKIDVSEFKPILKLSPSVYLLSQKKLEDNNTKSLSFECEFLTISDLTLNNKIFRYSISKEVLIFTPIEDSYMVYRKPISNKEYTKGEEKPHYVAAPTIFFIEEDKNIQSILDTYFSKINKPKENSKEKETSLLTIRDDNSDYCLTNLKVYEKTNKNHFYILFSILKNNTNATDNETREFRLIRGHEQERETYAMEVLEPDWNRSLFNEEVYNYYLEHKDSILTFVPDYSLATNLQQKSNIKLLYKINDNSFLIDTIQIETDPKIKEIILNCSIVEFATIMKYKKSCYYIISNDEIKFSISDDGRLLYSRKTKSRKLFTEGGDYIEDIPVVDETEIGYTDYRKDMIQTNNYISLMKK